MSTKPLTIKTAKGRTLYLMPNGTGYETSRSRRERRLAAAQR